MADRQERSSRSRARRGWWRIRQQTRTPGRRSRRPPWLPAVGWTLAGLALAGYLVNELTVDIPLIHYGMFAVLFVGAWLGLRALR